jgi:hypothetical protein
MVDCVCEKAVERNRKVMVRNDSKGTKEMGRNKLAVAKEPT